MKDTGAELGTTFIVYPSLLRPEVDKIPITPWTNFASPFTTKVTDRAHDDIYFLHSDNRDDSCTINSFPLLGRKIISAIACWGQH